MINDSKVLKYELRQTNTYLKSKTIADNTAKAIQVSFIMKNYHNMLQHLKQRYSINSTVKCEL